MKQSRREFLGNAGKLFTGICLLPAKTPKVIISGAGDVTLGWAFPRMFDALKKEFGEEYAFQAPFEKVAEYFRNSDISIVNLEGTLTNYTNPRPKKFNFRGSPEFAKCLNLGNISIVNLSNNHFMDFYERGAIETIETLEESKIEYCGGGRTIEEASKPKIIEKNGIKIAFLGYADIGKEYPARIGRAGTNPFEIEKIKREVNEAKSISDIVAVSCHWGIERAVIPTNTQETYAKTLVDSGANIVFGHHPHVLQGIEKYNGAVIFYSLGNFVFGGNTFPNDRDSIIARVTCNKTGVEDSEIVPVITHPRSTYFQPFVPDEMKKREIELKLSKRSAQI